MLFIFILSERPPHERSDLTSPTHPCKLSPWKNLQAHTWKHYPCQLATTLAACTQCDQMEVTVLKQAKKARNLRMGEGTQVRKTILTFQSPRTARRHPQTARRRPPWSTGKWGCSRQDKIFLPHTGVFGGITDRVVSLLEWEILLCTAAASWVIKKERPLKRVPS